jgi:aminopeptidase N
LKGALFFVALRDRIGDRAFFDALHAYYSDYHYEIASPADLLGEFERSCGCKLKDLYQEWGVE